MKTYPKNLARVSKYVSRGYSSVQKVSVDVTSMEAAEWCCEQLLSATSNARVYVATATPVMEADKFGRVRYLVVVTYKA